MYSTIGIPDTTWSLVWDNSQANPAAIINSVAAFLCMSSAGQAESVSMTYCPSTYMQELCNQGWEDKYRREKREETD